MLVKTKGEYSVEGSVAAHAEKTRELSALELATGPLLADEMGYLYRKHGGTGFINLVLYIESNCLVEVRLGLSRASTRGNWIT